MEKKILGIGNALVDILIKLPNDGFLEQLSFPKGSMQLVNRELNDSIQKEIENLKKQCVIGGSASNTIRGIACLGMQSGFIGMIGKDSFGAFFEQELIDIGISSQLFYSQTETGTASTFISPDSERTFATYLGAAIELNAKLISENLFKGYDYFHIEGYLLQNHELINNAVKMAKSMGLRVSLDLASYNVVKENLDFLKSLIKDYVDIVFANEEEAKAFTDLSPEEALEEISKMCEIAVVKVGAKGSMIKRGNEKITVGALNVNAIDTTGAGDLYAAGFLFGLANGYSLEKSGNIGKILAGNIIEVIGVKMDNTRWESIKEEVAKL